VKVNRSPSTQPRPEPPKTQGRAWGCRTRCVAPTAVGASPQCRRGRGVARPAVMIEYIGTCSHYFGTDLSLKVHLDIFLFLS
jgi:hypothetical protein